MASSNSTINAGVGTMKSQLSNSSATGAAKADIGDRIKDMEELSLKYQELANEQVITQARKAGNDAIKSVG